jgi:hypothetical protein
VAVVSIVRACRGDGERLGIEMERYNALFAIQGRRGECTRVEGVQQYSGSTAVRWEYSSAAGTK